MNYRNPELRERLAAEYALGTLRGAVRRRFERLMREDRALRDLVADWEGRLNPLAEWVRPVAPPPRVWEAIAREVGVPAPVERRSWAGAVWNSLGFWRAAGFAATTAAIALLVYVAMTPRFAPPTHVAVLADEKAQPVLLASFDLPSGELKLEPIDLPPVETGKSLELWLIAPSAATPRSLGLLEDGRYAVEFQPTRAAVVARGVLAVSLEPAGGSPTGAPTGPVLYTGAVVPNP